MAWVNFERLYGVNGAIVSVLIYFLWTKKKSLRGSKRTLLLTQRLKVMAYLIANC